MLGSSSRSTPLPFSQIATLMGVRLAEPSEWTNNEDGIELTFSRVYGCVLLVCLCPGLLVLIQVIFPFINQMVEELGVTDNPDKIGFYSGLVESCFALVQSFTVYHWATLSE